MYRPYRYMANSDYTRCSILKARQNHSLPPASAWKGHLRIYRQQVSSILVFYLIPQLIFPAFLLQVNTTIETELDFLLKFLTNRLLRCIASDYHGKLSQPITNHSPTLVFYITLNSKNHHPVAWCYIKW